MSSDRLTTLLARAKDGSATSADAATVAAMLLDLTDSKDRYDALFVLGKAGDPTYASLVETFLESRDDPFLARLAVQILSNWWGLGAQYIPELLGFVRGVPWDVESGGYVQSVALSSAGEVLRVSPDPALLGAVLEAFDSRDSPDKLKREAYAALLRAAGVHWKDVPGAASESWRQPAAAILDDLRRRVRRKH